MCDLLYMNVPLAMAADTTCVCGLAVGSRLIQITRRRTCHRYYYYESVSCPLHQCGQIFLYILRYCMGEHSVDVKPCVRRLNELACVANVSGKEGPCTAAKTRLKSRYFAPF